MILTNNSKKKKEKHFDSYQQQHRLQMHSAPRLNSKQVWFKKAGIARATWTKNRAQSGK